MENKLRRSSLPAETSIGRVSLRVPDLTRATDFYESVLGLQRVSVPSFDSVELAATSSSPALVRLVEDKTARRPQPISSGLFHLAILVPTRADLGYAFLRLSARGWRLDGVADHAVSEAIYLTDPDRNGIEIYRDRPRSEWKWNSGEIQMTTEPLDINSIISEARATYASDPGFDESTRIGHVHLKVSKPDRSAKFYRDIIGMDVVSSSLPGARFLSAGGYHHHLGLNNWMSASATNVNPHALGLIEWELLLPTTSALVELSSRLEAGGIKAEAMPQGVRVVDPDGISFSAIVRDSS